MKIFLKQIIIIDLILLFSALPLFGQEGFTSFMTDEDTPGLQWSGKGILNTRYYADYSNVMESNIDVYPEMNLDLDYSSDRSEFHGRINISGNPNYQTLDEVSQYLEQMIDEAWFQIFFNNFNIETGYIKLIWGKGIKHLLLTTLMPLIIQILLIHHIWIER